MDDFIKNFERTEFSDYLHGILGRSLVVATRFDKMCTFLYKAIEIHSTLIEKKSEDNFEKMNDFFKKHVSLGNSIKLLGLPDDITSTLYKAKDSRNEIVHSLPNTIAIGEDLTDQGLFIEETKKLVSDVVEGDIIISILTCAYNNSPLPVKDFLDKYKYSVLSWVIEE